MKKNKIIRISKNNEDSTMYVTTKQMKTEYSM